VVVAVAVAVRLLADVEASAHVLMTRTVKRKKRS